MTFSKLQGQYLNKVASDFRNPIHTYYLHYVAIFKATPENDILILQPVNTMQTHNIEYQDFSYADTAVLIDNIAYIF